MMRQNYIIFVLHVHQKNKKKTGGEMSARDLYNLMVY